ERFFEEDGKIYWHIIDPDDGRPTDNGIVSVTIVGKDGFLCDALSTALFVKGLEKAISFWQQSDDFDAVFVTKDGTVYVTQGIADSFTLSSEYYNAEKIVLTK
ncbi:MAG: FAD:protein FMN transferase, partial [Butyrivibrio sp.]|nr:FAD:protein FMN transferase [Butyrivibrio sp.]